MANGNMTTYLATAMVAVGFVLMVVAWNGAASSTRAGSSLPAVGHLPGLALVIAGLTLALVQEIRVLAGELVDSWRAGHHRGRLRVPLSAPAAVPDEDARGRDRRHLPRPVVPRRRRAQRPAAHGARRRHRPWAGAVPHLRARPPPTA